MKLAIRSVADRGDLDKERLFLKVRSDTDVGDYALVQSGFYDGSVTIDIHYTYWFPYKRVEAKDLVVLYTKVGRGNEKELENGRTAHFFYWGLSNAIWGGIDRAPVLLHAPTWTSKDPSDL